MAEEIFRGQIISVQVDEVVLPNNETLRMEVVRHPGGAAVVAIDQEHRVCLLKQYRPVFDDWIWELPAGKIDDQEPPSETAVRELEEEAGCLATEWQELGKVVSSPGVFDEVVYLYLARQLNHVGAKAEDHEVFEVHWIPLQQALQWADQGVINDGKTLVALYRTQQKLEQE